MDDYIVLSSIVAPTLERAEKLVPPEFVEAYRWFEQQIILSHLPMGKHTPSGFLFPLARQSGIFSPNYQNLPSKGAGKKKYALSIHSEGQKHYNDSDILRRDDGTWILDYCAHKPSVDSREMNIYNDEMMNCLVDGVPVAVLVKRRDGGYNNLGLGYIERYNRVTDVFTIHGPATIKNEERGVFSLIPFAHLVEGDLLLHGNVDERKRKLIEAIYREKQSEFRQKLMAAYNGRCALTGIDVPQVLQAAHIDPYRGLTSQRVQNGILLRADMHLLFDAYLISVNPHTFTLAVSDSIRSSFYSNYDGVKVNVPEDKSLQPDRKSLELHFRQFQEQNKHHLQNRRGLCAQ